MAPDLRTNVAVVTGGGRGIGASICRALGQAGATVVVAARTECQIRTVADQIVAAGGAALPLQVDLASEASVIALFQTVMETFGRIDTLVNNAGVGVYGPVMDYAAADLDALLAVNVRGTFLCCREALRRMARARKGYIINISSVLGFKGYANQAAYTATKHAVMGLTKSLAVEAQAYGVRVSAVSPGGVDTEMVRSSRPDLDPSVLLRPEDVAQAVLYLLSLSETAAVDEIYLRRAAGTPF